jgi:hypothetical protein
LVTQTTINVFIIYNVTLVSALQQQQQQIHKEQQIKLEDIFSFQVPVCGGNLKSPVDKVSDYIGEVTYRIGNRIYVENAD